MKRTRIFGLLGIATLCLATSVPHTAWAQAPVEPDPALGETIEFVRSNRTLPVSLETTVFKPPGAGPFPVLVINHGKATGNNRLQPRARYSNIARLFLMRGWAVVLPMRQGFSKSGGAAVGEGCNIAANGEAQADDVNAVTTWLTQQPWADKERMAMFGQSHGGLTTLAYAQEPHPGYKLFVNFAGGLRFTGSGCPWENEIAVAYGRYGAKTKVPSIWFYGENDSYFPPNVIGPAHAAYVKAGGQAELVAYGPFGVDAHGMFGANSGLNIWWPKVRDKLQALGLPMAVVNPQFAPPRPAAASAPTPAASTP